MDDDLEGDCDYNERIKMEDKIDKSLDKISTRYISTYNDKHSVDPPKKWPPEEYDGVNPATFEPVDNVETGVDGVEDTFSENYRIFHENLREKTYNEDVKDIPDKENLKLIVDDKGDMKWVGLFINNYNNGLDEVEAAETAVKDNSSDTEHNGKMETLKAKEDALIIIRYRLESAKAKIITSKIKIEPWSNFTPTLVSIKNDNYPNILTQENEWLDQRGNIPKNKGDSDSVRVKFYEELDNTLFVLNEEHARPDGLGLELVGLDLGPVGLVEPDGSEKLLGEGLSTPRGPTPTPVPTGGSMKGGGNRKPNKKLNLLEWLFLALGYKSSEEESVNATLNEVDKHQGIPSDKNPVPPPPPKHPYGFITKGGKIGNGGSFKTPFKVIFCGRDSQDKRNLMQPVLNVNGSGPGSINPYFKEVVAKKPEPDNTPLTNLSFRTPLDDYILLQVDKKGTSMKEINDEYKLGTLLSNPMFNYVTPPGVVLNQTVKLSPEPILIGNDPNTSPQYCINKSGTSFFYCLSKKCNVDITSGAKAIISKPSRYYTDKIYVEHFKNIGKAFYKLVYDVGYLTTDIKPDNMCEDESKKYGQFIDLDERFYDGRWSILLTANKYKEAALCYMIIQYISTYYIHIFRTYNLYIITGKNGNQDFIKDVKRTIIFVEQQCIKKNKLSKYFKNSNSGKILRNIMREIDTRVLQRHKTNSGIICPPPITQIKWAQRTLDNFGVNGRRGTMTSMFTHYHRQIYASDGYAVTLTSAIKIIITKWKAINITGGKKRRKLTKSKKSRKRKNRKNRKNSKRISGKRKNSKKRKRSKQRIR